MVRRMAHEIETRFRGAKVRDVGLLPDGRTAIALWKRGETQLLCIDVFSSPPLVTVEDAELPIAAEPGFIRATGAALRGMSLLSAKSRKGDRLMRLTFGTRSRFGVGDQVDLYIELVPRFGNIVLVKGESVVAAAKEFSLAQNGTRAVEAGMQYQPPPIVERPTLAGAQHTGEIESDELLHNAVYVYRRNGVIDQAYLTPLARFAEEPATRNDSLLDVLHQYREERIGSGERRRTALRRNALLKRLEDRERKAEDEIAAISAKRRKAEGREKLREEGEAIYASLYEIAGENEQNEAKERAAKLFAQYKKLGSAIPHLDEREKTLNELRRSIDHLRWEVERADDSDLDDVAAAVAHVDPRTQRTTVQTRKRKRPPLEFRTSSGSRILVGRSPSENADLTFRVARPNDLWFHAQNIPGAHVILQRDDRDEPPDEDIAKAAALAASYSKAKSSGKVPIDYTQRKYVRAQKNAPPGLVWYTNPRTIIAEREDDTAPIQKGRH